MRHNILINTRSKKLKKLLLVSFLCLFSFSGYSAKRVIKLVNHQYEGVKQWLPGTIYVEKGDDVEIHLINKKGIHGFRIKAFNIEEQVNSKKVKIVKFKASKKGIFKVDCQMHGAHVGGQLIIK